MPGVPDERPAETLCPTVLWLGHERGALLHPPGGPGERLEEATHHGLQDGGQVGLPLQSCPVLIIKFLGGENDQPYRLIKVYAQFY